MLDKQSKIILKYLITISDENNVISDSNLIYRLVPKYTKQQIEDSVGYLSKSSYLKAHYADGGIYFVNIYYEGLHYKDFDRIEFKSFLMKSIVTPIVVSTITTLLALWLNGYFPTRI